MRFARIILSIAVAALAAASLVGPARAQQPTAPTLTINQVDAKAFPKLTVVVTALDPRGVPAKGLTAAQFQAFDKNTQLTISNVQAAQDQGLRLATVIVIDVSGSMAGDPFERAKQAATDFVRSMGANDEAAIIAFNDKVTPVVALTSDRQKLTAGIAGLQATGGTALYEAVQTSSFIAGAATAARSGVIFLSDGENDTRSSNATADGAIAAAKGAGVPVFTIGFGAAPDTTFLQGLAAETQGQYRAANSANIGSVYADIAALMRNQYIITLQGIGKADGGDGSLQVIAFVGNTPAASVATYKRGTAPVVAPVQPAAADTAPAVPKPAAKKSNLAAFIFAGVIVAVGVIVIAWLLLMWNRRRKLRRDQLRVIAPNLRQAAAQPLDTTTPVRAFGGSNGSAAVGTPVGTGLLREKNGTGQVYQLGDGPAIIGTSARICNIVFPPSDRIAGEHARIWRRDGHYVLHHTGGMSRKTIVAGQEAEWLTLEPGDEVTVGPHKLVFEDPG